MNPPDQKWQNRVKGILKAELARRHISYRDLAEKLATIGVTDNERNIANKLSRGTFTAAFFVQCLDAIGCRTLRLDRDDWLARNSPEQARDRRRPKRRYAALSVRLDVAPFQWSRRCRIRTNTNGTCALRNERMISRMTLGCG